MPREVANLLVTGRAIGATGSRTRRPGTWRAARWRDTAQGSFAAVSLRGRSLERVPLDRVQAELARQGVRVC